MVDKVRQPSAPTMFEPMDGPTMLSLSDSRVVTPKAARQISETLKKRILAGEFPRVPIYRPPVSCSRSSASAARPCAKRSTRSRPTV